MSRVRYCCIDLQLARGPELGTPNLKPGPCTDFILWRSRLGLDTNTENDRGFILETNAREQGHIQPSCPSSGEPAAAAPAEWVGHRRLSTVRYADIYLKRYAFSGFHRV